MEKKYFYNLYNNIKKFNLKIKNNYYIKNKIINLIGGDRDADILSMEQTLNTINNDLTTYMQNQEQQNTENNDFVTSIESFLQVAEPYITKQQALSTQLSGVGLDDAKLQRLEKIQNTFDEIQTKISKLVS